MPIFGGGYLHDAVNILCMCVWMCILYKNKNSPGSTRTVSQLLPFIRMLFRHSTVSSFTYLEAPIVGLHQNLVCMTRERMDR